jgi:hypothetical protein
MGNPDLAKVRMEDNTMIIFQYIQAISCRLFRTLEMASKFAGCWWALFVDEGG